MAKGATPAIVMLEAAGVTFAVTEFHHEPGERNYGQVAAEALGIDPDRVFKTLVANLATDAGIEQVVGIVPVSGQLSLRELAAALGGKRAEMCPVDLAQRLTGYVVGGISPFGQKKRLRMAIDVVVASADARAEGFGQVVPGRMALMASQVSDAFATKTRVDPAAVWTDAVLPPKAELNILPPARK